MKGYVEVHFLHLLWIPTTQKFHPALKLWDPRRTSRFHRAILWIFPFLLKFAQASFISQRYLFSKLRKKVAKKEDVATLFLTTQFVCRSQSSFKNQEVISALTSTVTCLRQSEHNLMAKNNHLVLGHSELLNKSEQASHSSPPVRPEKIATSVPIPRRCSPSGWQHNFLDQARNQWTTRFVTP